MKTEDGGVWSFTNEPIDIHQNDDYLDYLAAIAHAFMTLPVISVDSVRKYTGISDYVVVDSIEPTPIEKAIAAAERMREIVEVG